MDIMELIKILSNIKIGTGIIFESGRDEDLGEYEIDKGSIFTIFIMETDMTKEEFLKLYDTLKGEFQLREITENNTCLTKRLDYSGEITELYPSQLYLCGDFRNNKLSIFLDLTLNAIRKPKDFAILNLKPENF